MDFEIVFNLIFFSSLLSISIGLIRFRYLSWSGVCILILTSTSFIFDRVGITMAEYKIPNLYLGNIYSLIEFTIVSQFFNLQLKNQKTYFDFQIVNILFWSGSAVSYFFLKGS